MAMPGADAATSGGIDIISIGCMYKGPWEKKYWSSSRGKDRYPYPVGYQTAWAHSGSTYKMEILEGPRGPMFMISSDGHSCSGQTPDIAWRKFQKTGCPSLKILQRKRLSCKIDGVQLFGFKNPLVQRLFRELVASSYRMAEQHLETSSSCNGASAMEKDDQCENAGTDSDSEPNLPRPLVEKKKSPRHESIARQSVYQAHPKRPRPDTYNDKPLKPLKLKKMSNKVMVSKSCSTLEEKHEYNELPGASSAAVKLQSVGENLKSIDSSKHLREGVVLVKSDSKFFGTGSPVHTRKKPDRSENTDLRTVRLPVKTGEEDGDSLVPKDCLEINEVQLCVPDTLMQDDPINSASSVWEKSAQIMKEDSTDYGSINSDLVVADSDEEEMGKSNSNTSSGKSEFDSIGPAVAQSMMTLLLPQAIPLLKVFSRKKKEIFSSPKLSLYEVNSEHGNVEMGEKVDSADSAAAPFSTENLDQETMHTQNEDPGSRVSISEHRNSIVPDSFEDDQDGGPMDDYKTSFSETLEADDGNNRCASPSKEAHTKYVEGLCPVSDKARWDTHSCEKHRKHIEASPNPASVDAYGTKLTPTGNTVKGLVADPNAERGAAKIKTFAQVQNMIYARKKVSLEASSENYCGYLSKSVRHGNSGDESTSTMCHAFQFKEANMNSEVASNNVKPIALPNHNQGCTPQTQSKPKSCFFSPPISLQRPQESSYDNSVYGQRSTAEFNCSAFCNQGTNFRDESALKSVELQVCSDKEVYRNVRVNCELEGNVYVVGCYLHPMPVLSVLLSREGNEISICASCGLLAEKERTMFVYRISVEGEMTGCPSFLGYTRVTLPSAEYRPGREIAREKCGSQFTLDGRYLVLLDSFETPYCRKGRTDCVCSTCKLNCFENNAVKIVQVKPGYVSLMAKFKTDDNLRCILVCETNYIIAAGESGSLHVWAMNATWSAETESFVIPANGCNSPGIVELKRIPKCTLVVGLNGCGEFSLWDICNKVIISRFSGPGNSISQFLPISLITRSPAFGNTDLEVQIDAIMAATKVRFSNRTNNHTLLPLQEDIVVWLLVSTDPDSTAQYEHKSGPCQANPARCWRLALLIKNMVILGSQLDRSAATVGASAGKGIMGTHDGLVYSWELSTGTKLGILHHFRGSSVSCIAAAAATDDDSRVAGVVAVGADDGQLLVCLHP